MRFLFNKLIHPWAIKLIAQYLLYCGGASHVYPYGVKGRYVVIMNEQDYHAFQQLHRGKSCCDHD